MGFGTLVIINTFSGLSKQNVIFFGLRGNSRPSLETFQRRSFPASVAVEAIVPVFIFFRAVVVSMWSTIIVEPNKRNDDDDDSGDSGSYNVDGNHRAIFFPLKSFHFTNLFFFQISLFSIPPSCFATSAKPGNPLRLLREFFFPLIVQYPQRRWRLDRWKKLPRNSENEIGDKSFKIPSKSRKIEFSVKVD